MVSVLMRLDAGNLLMNWVYIEFRGASVRIENLKWNLQPVKRLKYLWSASCTRELAGYHQSIAKPSDMHVILVVNQGFNMWSFFLCRLCCRSLMSLHLLFMPTWGRVIAVPIFLWVPVKSPSISGGTQVEGGQYFLTTLSHPLACHFTSLH